MSTKSYTPMSVADQLRHQSYLEIFPSGGARWVESQDPEWMAYQTYRAAQRNHEPASSDAVVDSVKQQLKSKSRQGISIAPASAPDGRK